MSYNTTLLLVTTAAAGLGLGLALYVLRNKNKEHHADTANTTSHKKPEYFKSMFFGGDRPCLRLAPPMGTGIETVADAACSCKDHGEQLLVEWLNQANYTVDLCIMTITVKAVANTLATLQKAGLVVRVIMDRNMIRETNSIFLELLRSGVEVRCIKYSTDKMMHHKFIILDAAYPSRCLLNGSLNVTLRAVTGYNYENIIITNNEELVKGFTEEFNFIWNTFIPVTRKIIMEDEYVNVPGDFKVCDKRPPSKVLGKKIVHQKKESSPKRKNINIESVDRW